MTPRERDAIERVEDPDEWEIDAMMAERERDEDDGRTYSDPRDERDERLYDSD
jgi:hypothetical protein